MSYEELTVKNRSLLKRFSHTKRFELAIKLLCIRNDDRILDYGTGDGFMLEKMLAKKPASITGYEPMEKQYRELKDRVGKARQGKDSNSTSVIIINTLDQINSAEYTKLCCLEVLEHMTPDNRVKILEEIHSLIRQNDGLVVISVPIEVGLSGFAKNIARFMLRQSHYGITVANLFKSLVYMNIDRPKDDFISSHVGFNYHHLEAEIFTSGFVIKRRLSSPLPLLGGVLNSQMFYVLECQS